MIWGFVLQSLPTSLESGSHWWNISYYFQNHTVDVGKTFASSSATDLPATWWDFWAPRAQNTVSMGSNTQPLVIWQASLSLLLETYLSALFFFLTCSNLVPNNNTEWKSEQQTSQLPLWITVNSNLAKHRSYEILNRHRVSKWTLAPQLQIYRTRLCCEIRSNKQTNTEICLWEW